MQTLLFHKKISLQQKYRRSKEDNRYKWMYHLKLRNTTEY